MKKVGKKVLVYLCFYLGLTLLFSALMLGSYLLPDYNIRGHIAESIGQLSLEGVGYSPFFQQPSATLDTHTDALMLNIAFNKGKNEEQRTLEKAFENSFYEDNKSAITALETNTKTTAYSNHEYSRYWHGIQVMLRPLLIFFNYSEIRYLLMFVVIILLGIVFTMIGRQLGTKYGIALAITVCLMYITLIPMSLQYSSIFIVTLISMIAVMVLYKHHLQKYIAFLFFTIGALATYFDLLTYPLVTLGLPLVLAVLLENKANKGEKKVLSFMGFIIKLGVIWAIGYGLLFFTKWVIASIVLKKDAVTLAIEQLLFRVNGNERYPVNRLEVIRNNFDYFYIPTARYILAVVAAIWLVMLLLYKRERKEMKVWLPLIGIAIVPYIWYLAFAGHSSIHSWFTNKIQAMSIFAILSGMFYMIDETKIGKYINRKKGGN